MTAKQIQKPAHRTLLRDADYFNAHLVLEGLGWQIVDAAYEEVDGRATVTKLIHRFEENDALTAVTTQDQTLGLDYVDFYGDASDLST